MAIRNLEGKFGGLGLSIYLGGIALLLMVFQVRAETPQQSDDGWKPYRPAPQIPVWIQDPYTSDSVLTYVSEPDKSLWNAQRITDYENSLKVDTAPPLGILTIEKLNINVPIYNGTDEFILDRGAGRIKGMAKMDEDGNLGISGHRDGFFRGLKDIQVGDDIEIQTTRGVETYAVSSITIIPKEDVSVLAPTTEKMLTIVTCYPFYFVGHAPKRWIVKANVKHSPAEQQL
jgi:LPXTG-site transpeptidase (sortase) family protein